MEQVPITVVKPYTIPTFFIRWRRFWRTIKFVTGFVVIFLMLREVAPEAEEKLKLLYQMLDHIIIPFAKWVFSIIISLICKFFEAILSVLSK
jgi:hypothetical protein